MALFGWERVDRSDPYYKACLTGVVGLGGIAGIVSGAVAAPFTLGASFAAVPAGLVYVFAAGYIACPYLSPHIKRKLEIGAPLVDAEIRPAAEALASYTGVRNATEAVKLLSIVRAQRDHARFAPRCIDPALAAQKLLWTV